MKEIEDLKDENKMLKAANQSSMSSQSDNYYTESP